MSGPRVVLPPEIRALSLDQKIERLRALHPSDVDAIEMIVTDALEHRWNQRFHGGPCGGLRVRSLLPVLKGGA